MTKEEGQFAVLLEHAINELFAADQDFGCCPLCCGPCSVIHEMLVDGTLDRAVAARSNGSDWWRKEQRQVDREFLRTAWRRTECHSKD